MHRTLKLTLFLSFLFSIQLVPASAYTAPATIVQRENTGLVSQDSSGAFKAHEESLFAYQDSKLRPQIIPRLIINFITVIILIRFIYFLNYRKQEILFTFFTFNFIIFLIGYLLGKVEMGMGAAFGLFAVFSMLRYRTENLTTKDMTYLFLVIAIGLLTAVSNGTILDLVILNGAILLVTFCLEASLFIRKESSQTVIYENIELIKPENHPALITDLRNRTGLNIHRISIDKIDFLKDAALVSMFYVEQPVPKNQKITAPK